MTYKQLEQIAASWRGKVCLFGAGKIGTTWAYDIIVAAGIHVDFYCDNGKSAGTQIRDGVCTISKEELYALKDDVFVFVTVAEKYQDAIKTQLEENGVKNIFCVEIASLSYFMDDIMGEGDEKKIAQYKCVTDDATFLKSYFKKSLGYELNLENPKTFNEKLQWLKLYDRNPEYTKMVDKAEAKKYVADILGEEYIIPTLGVYDSFDQIDFDKLPERFVLKCTHDSGSVVICRDKSAFDKEAARKKLTKALGVNLFWYGREWAYKDVKPRIIAEKYLEGGDTSNLSDYKLLCFNGICKYVFTVTNRFAFNGPCVTFFDTAWNKLPIEYTYKIDQNDIDCPKELEKMKIVSYQLSRHLPFCRCDYYNIGDKIYFGELTFYTGAGFQSFKPEKYDGILGKWIDLSNVGGGTPFSLIIAFCGFTKRKGLRRRESRTTNFSASTAKLRRFGLAASAGRKS